MRLHAAANNTVAILVGIEDYSGKAEWALDGPATSTMRMAQWLIRQSVPPGNIRLLINYSKARSEESALRRDELRRFVNQHGIAVTEPTRANIEQALLPDSLPKMARYPGNLLVYFCGHGLASHRNERRYALTADATPDSYQAIDVDYQAGYWRLHSNPSRLFTSQWFIQDACGQATTAKRSPVFSSSDLPDTAAGTSQYCLYAARPGEFAKANSDKATEFTYELLSILNNLELAGLDLAELYTQIEDRFRGRPQHPTVHRRDEHLARATLSAITSQNHCTEGKELSRMLQQSAISFKLISTVYAEITGAESLPSSQVEDLFRSLEELILDDKSGLKPVELFAIRLESYCRRNAESVATGTDDRVAYAATFQALKQWVDAGPNASNALAVSAERKRLDTFALQSQQSPTIVLELGGASVPAEARAWRYYDGAIKDYCTIALGATTLEQQLSEALDKLLEKQWLFSETVIELVLPLNRVFQYFNDIQVVADVQAQVQYQLGHRQLLLVVRIAERWNNHVWFRRWQEYWNTTADWRNGKPTVAWLHHGAKPHNEGWIWLGANDIKNATLLAALRKALYEGLAFAAWCDDPQSKAVEEALTRHSYVDRLRLLQELGDLSGKGQRLTCLVDDPCRVPPGAGAINSPLIQPFMRGGS